MMRLVGFATMIAGICVGTIAVGQEAGDGAFDPAAISSPDGENDPAAENEEDQVQKEEQARRAPVQTEERRCAFCGPQIGVGQAATTATHVQTSM